MQKFFAWSIPSPRYIRTPSFLAFSETFPSTTSPSILFCSGSNSTKRPLAKNLQWRSVSVTSVLFSVVTSGTVSFSTKGFSLSSKWNHRLAEALDCHLCFRLGKRYHRVLGRWFCTRSVFLHGCFHSNRTLCVHRALTAPPFPCGISAHSTWNSPYRDALLPL